MYMFLFSILKHTSCSTKAPSFCPFSIGQQLESTWSHRSRVLDSVYNSHSEKTLALPWSVRPYDANDGEPSCTEAPFCNADRGSGDTSCNQSLHTEGTSMSRI